MTEGCSNCGRLRRGSALRCAACHVYRYRHGGQERPVELMLSATRRRIERSIQAELRRGVELWEDDRSLTA